MKYDGPSGVLEFERVKECFSGCSLTGTIRGCSYLPSGMTGIDSYNPEFPSKICIRLNGISDDLLKRSNVSDSLKLLQDDIAVRLNVNSEYFQYTERNAYSLNGYGRKIYDLMSENGDEMDFQDFRDSYNIFEGPVQVGKDFVPDKYTHVQTHQEYRKTGKFNIDIVFPGDRIGYVDTKLRTLVASLQE